MESLSFSQSTTTLIESTVLLITRFGQFVIIPRLLWKLSWSAYLRILHRTVTKFTRLHCMYLLENWQVFERKSYCKKILYIKIQFTSNIIITNMIYLLAVYIIIINIYIYIGYNQLYSIFYFSFFLMSHRQRGH